jgi:hypothetical protein
LHPLRSQSQTLPPKKKKSRDDAMAGLDFPGIATKVRSTFTFHHHHPSSSSSSSHENLQEEKKRKKEKEKENPPFCTTHTDRTP